jgi:hypothetical protein
MNFRGMTNKYLHESWHCYIDRILDPLLKIELLRQSVIDAISAHTIGGLHSINIDVQVLKLISKKISAEGKNGGNISFKELVALMPGNLVRIIAPRLLTDALRQ